MDSSSSSPQPTTFIQADATTFKPIVQLLTGVSNKPSFKLHERRHTHPLKSLKVRNRSRSCLGGAHPSPVTPLVDDPFGSPEERGIKEKGFYLHPSPRSGGEGEMPRLLELFPVVKEER